MKAILLAALGAILLLPAARAADAKSELNALVARVNDRIKAGARAESEFADELKEFDAILARHPGQDDAAGVMFMQATLYLEVLDESAKAKAILEKLRAKYPGSDAAGSAAKALEAIQKRDAAAKIQATLKVGAPFPPFDERSLDGKPFSLAAVQGRVVLIDFWATWCGPCLRELPNVQAAYDKYHARGFEVLGVSLDEDRSTLEAFLARRKLPWPQYFDGKRWENKLAAKYGILGIPATYLLDGQGRILGRDLHGDELDAAVAQALPAE